LIKKKSSWGGLDKEFLIGASRSKKEVEEDKSFDEVLTP
jgi:hypothetical protein